MYQIILGKDFLKELKKLIQSGNKSIKSDVQSAINEIKVDPHRKRPKANIKLISSRKESIYRIRLGKYRAVYEINETEKKIFITMIFIRGKGY